MCLRFVFLEVRSDPKEGSFYFRGTRNLFERNVTLAQLTEAVNEAGGYRALAALHVKSPRKTKQSDDEPSSEASDTSDDHEAHDKGDGGDKASNDMREEQRDHAIVKTLKGTEVLHCKFDGNGRDMRKLKAGSWFGICGHVLVVVDDRQIIEFFECVFFD